MERIYIKILESFPLISKVMPYYACTHRMFLMLSEVSKKTRLILIKNYTLFRRIMLEYSMEKSIDIKKLLMLNIPYDLFKFNIKNSNVNSVGHLLDLANKIKNKEGCYFDEHYMNEQLCLDKIYIDAKYIQDVKSVVDTLASVETVNSSDYSNKEHNAYSLIDLIVIQNIYYFGRNNRNNNVINVYEKECNNFELILQSFKRVEKLMFLDITDAFKKLRKLKQTEIIEVECLDFHCLDNDSIEDILDSDLLNYQIQSLKYNYYDCCLMRDTVLNKIAEVKPKELILTKISDVSNFINILSILPNNMTVYFDCNSWNDFNLKFCNAIVHVIKINKESSFSFYCKELSFDYNDLKETGMYFLNKNTICISNCNSFKVRNFFKENEDASLEFEEPSFMKFSQGSFFIIQTSSLSELKLDLIQIIELFKYTPNKKYFPMLSNKTKLIIKLRCAEDLSNFSYIISYIPIHCELEMTDIYYSYFHKEEIRNMSFTMSLVSEFKLCLFCDKMKSKIDYIIPILSELAVQMSLKHLELNMNTASECISILQLCKKCILLETIYIIYYKENTKINADLITEIRKEIFTNCCNIQQVKVKYEHNIFE